MGRISLPFLSFPSKLPNIALRSVWRKWESIIMCGGVIDEVNWFKGFLLVE
jgi:hypothetical protein